MTIDHNLSALKGSYLKRDSNLELLRIICMYFIVIHHLLTHAFNWILGYNFETVISSYALIATTINSFFFISVNCFILISGYFSIKLKFDKIFHIYLICVFYSSICYFFHLFNDHQIIGRTFIYQSILVISNTKDWWFIQSYFFLCLFSPLLNRAILNVNKMEHLTMLLLLTIVNVYFGFLWQNPINNNGYNLMNFIYLYLIGSYLKNYIPSINLRKNRFLYLGSYAILIFLFFSSLLINLFLLKSDFLIKRSWLYNNPLILLGSIFFFLFFLSFELRNKIINGIATSVFAIYLLHENQYIAPIIYSFIKGLLHYKFLSNNVVLVFLIILFYGLIIMFFLIITDKFFMLLIKPVEKWLLRNIEKPFGKISGRIVRILS